MGSGTWYKSTISTGRPNSAPMVCISCSLKSTVSGAFASMPRSMSLSGRALPVACEPNNITSLISGYCDNNAVNRLCTRDFPPRIAQAHGAVKYRFTEFHINAIGDEIAVAFKLKTLLGLRITERLLHICGDDFL